MIILFFTFTLVKHLSTTLKIGSVISFKAVLVMYPIVFRNILMNLNIGNEHQCGKLTAQYE